jgi:hypothetical protein
LVTNRAAARLSADSPTLERGLALRAYWRAERARRRSLPSPAIVGLPLTCQRQRALIDLAPPGR